ncbi:unnamed protein product [Somion occarium]|uniref:polynucleotide adenylyltransferase n=1 Tax=Somion occarium TaxID=3059160 RepID=A0ABP1DC88_9APHY
MASLPARPKSARIASSKPTPSASRSTSVGASSSAESRKSRRKNKNKKVDTQSEAGPSNSNNAVVDSPPNDNGASSSTSGSSMRANGHSSTFPESDFIPFSFDDEPELYEEPEAVDSKGKQKANDTQTENEKEPYAREWDKGKSRMLAKDSRSQAGQKRKSEQLDFNDDYLNKKQRVDAASRRAPWVWDVDWESCNNVAEMLHREVDDFINFISPTPVEEDIRTMTVALISRAVTEAFPDAKVLPFGSYETKLYLPLGDIDLVVISNSMAYSKTSNVLRALANTVKRANLTDKVRIIDKAKVPIIKFQTRHGRFSVDMSINQVNGIAAGKIIKHFLRELPALRPLVLIIKSFLSQRSMNEVFTGGLGSYSIVCLAISFLQMHPKIRRGEIDPTKNLGVLMMEFFELYGCYFNYEEVGISLRDGGSYYNKQQRGWYDYRSRYLLSIEDPGDASNDISRGTYNIMKVRTTLAGAHGIMTAAAYLHAGFISSRRGNRGRDRHDNPEDLSILASVMGVTQETINHRKLVQEVYDSQVLHRMLGVEPTIPVTEEVKRPNGNNKSSSSRCKPMSQTRSREAQESVKSAWNESDVDHSFDHSAAHASDEEEESRYGIANVREPHSQPPIKRRRTGKPEDEHTVFTSDASEEEVDELDPDPDPEPSVHLNVGTDDYDAHAVSEEESEYDVDGDEGEIKGPASEKRERTRSFWLSKGVDMGIID